MSSRKLQQWLCPIVALLVSMVGACSTKPPIKMEIDKTAPWASNVLDKGCKNMVQPYQLTDNTSVLLNYLVKTKTGVVLDEVFKRLPGAGSIVPSNLLPAGNEPLDDWDSLKDAAKQLSWLPMEAEVAYGEKLHQEETNILERNSKVGQKLYPVADDMLKKILDSVGQQTDYHFQLFILKESKGNAVARPGGFIYIEANILQNKAKHPKAYFALAHEISHVLQRHQTQAIQSMIVDSVTSKDNFIKLVTSMKGNPDSVLSFVKSGKDVFIRYHIDQELQADSCAVRMLGRVYQNPKDLAESLDAFIRDLPKKETPPEKKTVATIQETVEEKIKPVSDIVKSPIDQHPNNEERESNLKQMFTETSAEIAKGRGTGN